jgi:uncharacterized protein (DUF58 family)
VPRAQFFAKRWDRWIHRRIPRSHEITLNQRNLFIFPSAAGMGFLALLLVLLLVAINYQNNLIYGLVFLLATVFVIAIHLTFANLSGLVVKGGANTPVFLGDRASIAIDVVAKKRPRLSIKFELPRQEPPAGAASGASTDITNGTVVGTATAHEPFATLAFAEAGSITKCNVSAYPLNRGAFHAGRLLIESRYPLGLVRCWSWIDVAQTTWVYPRPIQPTMTSKYASSDKDDTSTPVLTSIDRLGDDLHSFRAYQQGDALKQIHWPSVARGDIPLVDLRAQNASDTEEIIDFNDYPNVDNETRLSWLCYRVAKAQAANRPFTLRLPGKEIACHVSDQKNSEALMALAQFPKSHVPKGDV